MTGTPPRGPKSVPPHDLEAEQSVLGAMLLSREALERALAHLGAGDFYSPAHGQLFDAMRSMHENGGAVDATILIAELRRLGTLQELGGPAAILEIQAATPGPANVLNYARVVKERAASRRALSALLETAAAIREGADPYMASESLSGVLAGIDRMGNMPKRSWLSIDDYLDEPAPTLGQWLVPGLCYRDSRIIVLASEKAGKSVALRQIAYCAAAGRHPFRLNEIRPVRVAILDAENPDREMRSTGEVLRKRLRADGKWADAKLALASYPFGLDLRNPRHWSEVNAFLEKAQPELLVTGPVYKMLSPQANESDVRFADAFQQLMGKLMERFGFALILEHHAPIGMKGQTREIRSMGGQRWQAWPDVTLALTAEMLHGQPTGDLDVTNPHPNRGTFDFPRRLQRARNANDYPWMATYRSREVRTAVEVDEHEEAI